MASAKSTASESQRGQPSDPRGLGKQGAGIGRIRLSGLTFELGVDEEDRVGGAQLDDEQLVHRAVIACEADRVAYREGREAEEQRALERPLGVVDGGGEGGGERLQLGEGAARRRLLEQLELHRIT